MCCHSIFDNLKLQQMDYIPCIAAAIVDLESQEVRNYAATMKKFSCNCIAVSRRYRKEQSTRQEALAHCKNAT